MKVGIVLIHGYTGSSLNLQPLADKLINVYGNESVKNISLPYHNTNEIPQFDETGFIGHISEEISKYINQNRKIIILGHSTGGNLALAFMAENGFVPDYLILAGVPYRIDSSAYNRWIEHRKGESTVPLINVAKMVSLINKTAKLKLISKDFYSLIINGENDRLVLSSDAHIWKSKLPENKTRLVIAPNTGHDIFHSLNSPYVIDIILRAVEDITDHCNDSISEIITVEPEVKRFISYSPFSRKHLAGCPSGKRVTNSDLKLSSLPENEPVFANIEITSECNFKCQFCARSRVEKSALNMDRVTFRQILELLPHSYRINLVGLGEPLLHPDIIDFIEIASSLKRRVGLVTNTSLLNSSLSKDLILAGLNSIAFSLDTVDQDTASQVRMGTKVDRVLEKIRHFVEIADAIRPLSKAVFTAVSVKTLPHLKDFVDAVSLLGIDILMLTDLNFKENVKDTIWQNANDEVIYSLRNTIKHAFLKKLPVLSVHALEEFGLASRYKDFLLLPTDQLYNRSEKRKYCYSPWQTLPIDVKGNISMCDCQPENIIGNILSDPFNEIWSGQKIKEYRKRMLNDNPPEACRICPRF